jgi:hypothetical protein
MVEMGVAGSHLYAMSAQIWSDHLSVICQIPTSGPEYLGRVVPHINQAEMVVFINQAANAGVAVNYPGHYAVRRETHHAKVHGAAGREIAMDSPPEHFTFRVEVQQVGNPLRFKMQDGQDGLAVELHCEVYWMDCPTEVLVYDEDLQGVVKPLPR